MKDKFIQSFSSSTQEIASENDDSPKQHLGINTEKTTYFILNRITTNKRKIENKNKADKIVDCGFNRKVPSNPKLLELVFFF